MNKPYVIVNELWCFLGLELHELRHSEYVWYFRFDVGVLVFPSFIQARKFARNTLCLTDGIYSIVSLEEVIGRERK